MVWTACNLVPGGIIVVDDRWHPFSPAVTNGIQRYFACGQVELQPFLIVDAPNQKYLTTKSHHTLSYDALLADAFFGPMLETKQSGDLDYMWNQVKTLRPALKPCETEAGCSIETLLSQAYWVGMMKDNFPTE